MAIDDDVSLSDVTVGDEVAVTDDVSFVEVMSVGDDVVNDPIDSENFVENNSVIDFVVSPGVDSSFDVVRSVIVAEVDWCGPLVVS